MAISLISAACCGAANGAAQISAHHNLTLAHISSFGLRVTSVAAAEICFADQGQPPVPDLDV